MSENVKQSNNVQQNQEQQLQQLSNLLVSAITQQQQVQYATQLQQLLAYINQKDDDTGLPNTQFNRRAYANVPAEQLQAAQLAAAAVTAKHKQVNSINKSLQHNHHNSNNNGGNAQNGQQTQNACTVQCIDPVTRRTVLYRPGKQQNGSNGKSVHQAAVNTYNPSNYWYQNGGGNNQQQYSGNSSWGYGNNSSMSGSRGGQVSSFPEPIGSNRPMKSDYFSDYSSSRTSPCSGSSSPGPNTSTLSSSGCGSSSGGVSDSEHSIDEQFKINNSTTHQTRQQNALNGNNTATGFQYNQHQSHSQHRMSSYDDDDVLSELNRQINQICFS